MMKKTLMLVCVLTVLTSIFTGLTTVQAADPIVGYVMSYFNGGAPVTDNLHLAYSTDGLNWTALNYNQPIFITQIGTMHMRDPFILKKQDGTFVLLGTDNWDSEYIMVYDSTDLINFTNGRLLRVNTTGMHSWAPEAIYDSATGKYAILWSGDDASNVCRTYVSYTTDFITVTNPTPTVFFAPGYSVIDASIEQYNGTNYLFYKDERDGYKAIKAAKSTTLNPGSFSVFTSNFITDAGTEGSFVVKSLSQNKWYLYADFYGQNGIFGCWSTTDLNATSWTKLSSGFSLPAGVRHANAVEVTQVQLDALIAKFGSPKLTRFQSYNFTDRYWRHYNYRARIDPNVSPIQDSQFKVVPGLANSSGYVSFESLDFPGYYLRQTNYDLYIQYNDGSAAFKSDATFKKVPGLKDSTWSSYQSYTYPTRYIRHYNYYLRVDPISTDTEKQDATFKEQ